MKHQETENNKERKIVLAAWFAVWLGVFAIFFGLMFACKEQSFNLTTLANYGNWLQGAVASLWSLAALLFIYATLLAQKKQMQQQEQELKEQKQQFELQHKSIQLQNFENSFFQMVNLLRGIVIEMEDNKGLEPAKGRACFVKWREHFKNIRLTAIENSHLPESMEAEYDLTMDAYITFFAVHQDQLGHYFRTLFHTIKLVTETKVLDSVIERKRYVSIVRAQLSAYELAFLFYNCNLELADRFRKYVIDYNLFEHLDDDLLLLKPHRQFLKMSFEKFSVKQV